MIGVKAKGGFEMNQEERMEPVLFHDLVRTDVWRNSTARLPLLLGQKADGSPLIADLAELRHLLFGGFTGEGKSVSIRSLVCGLASARTSDQVQFVLIDLKGVEFGGLKPLPHLWAPVVAGEKKAVYVLHRLATVVLGERARFREEKAFPSLVVVIDEFADLMGEHRKEVLPDLLRLACEGPDFGIHLVLATQRVDETNLPDELLEHLPGRMAFRIGSASSSQMILGCDQAMTLGNRWTLLRRNPNSDLIRSRSVWLDEDGVASVVAACGQRVPSAEYDDMARRLNRIQD